MILTDPTVINTIRNFNKKFFVCHSFSFPAIYPEFIL